MTTCKWCGNGLPFVSWWTGKRLDYSRSSICTGEGGAGSHEPGATEGTPATLQTEAVCEECSGNGKVLEKCPSCNGSGYEPRTQPSQPQELKIPEDLHYRYTKLYKILRLMGSGVPICTVEDEIAYIERIARAEGRQK